MQPIFKTNSAHQQKFFSLNLNNLIGLTHSVTLIDKVVDKLDIFTLIAQYQVEGTSSYYPKMLLKILFYGYLNNVYSCRKLAKATTENIYCMWLCGGLRPDFRNMNDFRGRKLKQNA